MLKLSRAIGWPLFLFWTVAALVMVALIVRHPGEGQWWLTLIIALGGAALWCPFTGTARVRRQITVRQPLRLVYDFLSKPANLHIWNPRAATSEPANVPAEVGREWTYLPARRWIRTSPLRHFFSRVDPPHLLEITATGRGLHAVYSYRLRDLGDLTEVTVDVSVGGIPAPAAWITVAIARFYPSRDIARLKRALDGLT